MVREGRFKPIRFKQSGCARQKADEGVLGQTGTQIKKKTRRGKAEKRERLCKNQIKPRRGGETFRGIPLKGLAAEYMTSWGKGAAAERYPHRSCLQPEGAERKRKDCSD